MRGQSYQVHLLPNSIFGEKTGKYVRLCTCIKCYCISHAWHRQHKGGLFQWYCDKRQLVIMFYSWVLYNWRIKGTCQFIVYSRQLYYSLKRDTCSSTETERLDLGIKCLYGTFWSVLVLSCQTYSLPIIYTHTHTHWMNSGKLSLALKAQCSLTGSSQGCDGWREALHGEELDQTEEMNI